LPCLIDLHFDQLSEQLTLPEKPLVLRVLVHPHARVIGRVIVVKFKGRVASLDVGVPANTVEDRASRVVLKAGLNHLPSELVEQHIDVRVLGEMDQELSFEPAQALGRHCSLQRVLRIAR
jgi:hypothetical protein